MEHVQHFFKSHPGINDVYDANGVLFLKEEYATKYLTDKKGEVKHFTREQLTDNSGAGGSTVQQPHGNTITEGDSTGQPSEKTETEQNTETGNATDYNEKSVEEIEVLITDQEKVINVKEEAEKAWIDPAQQATAHAELEEEYLKLEALQSALQVKKQQQPL